MIVLLLHSRRPVWQYLGMSTEATEIWNRATRGGTATRPGDAALTAILEFDGLANNGGLSHACDVLTDQELTAAEAGYRYLQMPAVAEMIVEARALSGENPDHDEPFDRLEAGFFDLIDHGKVTDRQFETMLRERRDDFAPVTESDREEGQRHGT